MKTATRLFTLSVLMLCVGLINANAQGRGRGHGGGNGRDHHDGGHHNDHHDNHYNHYDHHASVQHVYHHAHRDVYYRPVPPPRVIVVHQPVPVRPRYVYYRDYNVYYDCHRSVYISYSGRGWAVSAALPVCLDRVDVRRANRVSVEYYDDDFPTYLDRGTPAYGAVYTD